MPSQNAKLEGWSQRMGASPNETLMDQVAYYARVSNPTSQISALKSDGLIKYLMRHKLYAGQKLGLDIQTVH